MSDTQLIFLAIIGVQFLTLAAVGVVLWRQHNLKKGMTLLAKAIIKGKTP